MQAARILAGWPALGAEIDERTLPQEVRYDEIGGVSYTKGCYTGQETVARLHFRGHPNRELRGLWWRSDEPEPLNGGSRSVLSGEREVGIGAEPRSTLDGPGHRPRGASPRGGPGRRGDRGRPAGDGGGAPLPGRRARWLNHDTGPGGAPGPCQRSMEPGAYLARVPGHHRVGRRRHRAVVRHPAHAGVGRAAAGAISPVVSPAGAASLLATRGEHEHRRHQEELLHHVLLARFGWPARIRVDALPAPSACRAGEGDARARR